MRRDLTEGEIRQLERDARALLPPPVLDKLARLIGELRVAREREAVVMHLHDLEGRY